MTVAQILAVSIFVVMFVLMVLDKIENSTSHSWLAH